LLRLYILDRSIMLLISAAIFCPCFLLVHLGQLFPNPDAMRLDNEELSLVLLHGGMRGDVRG
jgi:hypothetical protein